MNTESKFPLFSDPAAKKIANPGNVKVEGETAAPDALVSKNRLGFGETLQRERELRAISLDDIAASTKIGTRMLHALETEEFEKLPGGIFNKGFVRAYAKYLGLDEEQAVTDYLAAEAECERRRNAPPTPEEGRPGQPQLFAITGGSRPDNAYNIRANAELMQQPPADHARGFMVAGVTLVFVLGLAGFGWKYFTTHPAATVADANTATARSAVATSPPQTAPPPSGNVPDQSAAASSGNNPISDSAATDKSADISDENKLPSTSSNTDSSDLKSQSTAAELTLDLRADDQSWAQITADGKPLFTGLLDRDSTKSFRATKELVVKLGNAPAIAMTYNGKLLPRFTQDAKTRTLTFNAGGVVSR